MIVPDRDGGGEVRQRCVGTFDGLGLVSYALMELEDLGELHGLAAHSARALISGSALNIPPGVLHSHWETEVYLGWLPRQLQWQATAQDVACLLYGDDEPCHEGIGHRAPPLGLQPTDGAQLLQAECLLEAATTEVVLAPCELMRVYEAVKADWAPDLTLQGLESGLQGARCHIPLRRENLTNTVFGFLNEMSGRSGRRIPIFAMSRKQAAGGVGADF